MWIAEKVPLISPSQVGERHFWRGDIRGGGVLRQDAFARVAAAAAEGRLTFFSARCA